MLRRPTTLLCLAALLAAPAAALAQDAAAVPAEAAVDAAPAAATEAAPEPATTPVTKGAFTVVLELTGTFDAKDPVEVELKPLVYGGELEVVEAAEAGRVTAGQTLVRFKTEKIDEQLKNAELDLALAQKALQKQVEESQRQEEATAIAIQKADLDARNADLALRNFQEVEMPLRTQESAQRLQQTKDNIQDQEEELAQLEKMYQADELVEETEEIVMKRARRQLDRSRRVLEFQTRRDALLRELELPRELEGLKLAQRKATNDRERVNATAKIALEHARLELDKARAAAARQEEQLGKLRKDREALVVTAPLTGLAVPGSLTRGKWSAIDETARELRPGGKVKAGQTLFTIVEPGAVRVRTTVPEAQLFQVREGQTAKVVPGVLPDTTLDAKVVRVAPVATGTEYEVLLELAAGEPRLLPGYTAKVKLTTAEKTDALTVPSGAVAGTGDARHVFVAIAGGKPQKRDVKVGATSGGRTEITAGLVEGDRVLESPPKAK